MDVKWHWPNFKLSLTPKCLTLSHVLAYAIFAHVQ